MRHRQNKEGIAYYGHTMRKQGSCLEKEITQGTMQGARRRRRPRSAWMDNIKTWTGLPVEESIGSRTAKEQNRTPIVNCQHANLRIYNGSLHSN